MDGYQLTASDIVIRTADNATIPNDPENRDRAKYDAWLKAGGVPKPWLAPAQSIMAQDLMAQFTADDAGKIQTAIAGNVQIWLLWSSMHAQKDPMIVTSARFLAGWNALSQVLGQERMTAIATALNVTTG